MKLSLLPFPKSVAVMFFAEPKLLMLNSARFGESNPHLPEGKVAFQVWVDLPDLPADDRGGWVKHAIAWAVANTELIEREIRRAMIAPINLN